MFDKNFIFSEKKPDQIKRHLLFWFFYWLYFTALHAAHSGGKPEINYFRNVPYAVVEAFSLLVPQVFLTYVLISYILPEFLLKSRYILSMIWIIVSVVLTAFMTYVMLEYVNPVLAESILPKRYQVRNPRPNAATFYVSLIVSFKGTLVAASAACCIKLFKYWYQNLELLKEKTQAQLQLLTAQVQPHFLFNTLNNIYSVIQNESPRGSKMVMELSQILRYILTEGSKELVPLKMELIMINEYINLEKVRYGNNLELHVVIPGETGRLEILPLILLPFIENCFKHGTQNFLNHPWVNLKIEIHDSIMDMKLINGKDDIQIDAPMKSGIGINNVKKRLELMYKNKYQLEIIDETNVFIVNLKIQLSEAKHQSKIQNDATPVFHQT